MSFPAIYQRAHIVLLGALGLSFLCYWLGHGNGAAMLVSAAFLAVAALAFVVMLLAALLDLGHALFRATLWLVRLVRSGGRTKLGRSGR